MRSLSSGAAGGYVAAASLSTMSDPAGTSSTPGLVQNCPAPRVNEPMKPATISSARSAAAAAVTKTGLVLPNSP